MNTTQIAPTASNVFAWYDAEQAEIATLVEALLVAGGIDAEADAAIIARMERAEAVLANIVSVAFAVAA
jgi:hypothetical protein